MKSVQVCRCKIYYGNFHFKSRETNLFEYSCGRKYGSDYECVDGLSCLEKYTYIYIKDRIELDIIYPLL